MLHDDGQEKGVEREKKHKLLDRSLQVKYNTAFAAFLFIYSAGGVRTLELYVLFLASY